MTDKIDYTADFDILLDASCNYSTDIRQLQDIINNVLEDSDIGESLYSNSFFIKTEIKTGFGTGVVYVGMKSVESSHMVTLGVYRKEGFKGFWEEYVLTRYYGEHEERIKVAGIHNALEYVTHYNNCISKLYHCINFFKEGS